MKKIELEDLEFRKVLYTEWRRSLINGAYYFGSKNKESRIIRNSASIYHYLQKLFDNWKYPMTAHDYSIALRDRFSIRISDHMVRRILKESLLLSYKKGKSRPVGLNFSKQQAMKWFSAVKIIPYISKFQMLISINESSFSRTTKLTNSWLMKGVSQELLNICFEGSTSLITSISSTGIVFAFKTSGAVDGLMFVEYLKRLKQVLKEDFEINIENCLIIIDNATIHRSKVTWSFKEKKNFELPLFLHICQSSTQLKNTFQYWRIWCSEE